MAKLLPELGIFDLGENRPQELRKKAVALANGEIRWHMIGHLQRNKVPETLDFAQLIHSVDSARLFAEIAKESGKRKNKTKILLQVNGSREEAKQGFDYAELTEFLVRAKADHRVEIAGCMTMAAHLDNPEECRTTFRELRKFAEKHLPGSQLSMGMSNDFEVAIEEGATLIRLGTVLFEGLTGIEESARSN